MEMIEIEEVRAILEANKALRRDAEDRSGRVLISAMIFGIMGLIIGFLLGLILGMQIQ